MSLNVTRLTHYDASSQTNITFPPRPADRSLEDILSSYSMLSDAFAELADDIANCLDECSLEAAGLDKLEKILTDNLTLKTNDWERNTGNIVHQLLCLIKSKNISAPIAVNELSSQLADHSTSTVFKWDDDTCENIGKVINFLLRSNSEIGSRLLLLLLKHEIVTNDMCVSRYEAPSYDLIWQMIDEVSKSRFKLDGNLPSETLLKLSTLENRYGTSIRDQIIKMIENVNTEQWFDVALTDKEGILSQSKELPEVQDAYTQTELVVPAPHMHQRVSGNTAREELVKWAFESAKILYNSGTLPEERIKVVSDADKKLTALFTAKPDNWDLNTSEELQTLVSYLSEKRVFTANAENELNALIIHHSKLTLSTVTDQTYDLIGNLLCALFKVNPTVSSNLLLQLITHEEKAMKMNIPQINCYKNIWQKLDTDSLKAFGASLKMNHIFFETVFEMSKLRSLNALKPVRNILSVLLKKDT